MNTHPLFFDAHLDLSMNALEWNRDLRWSIDDIRDWEKEMTDKPDRGKGTVNFYQLRKGNIGIVIGTQIARYSRQTKFPGASWNSAEQAWAQTQGQLAWYETMQDEGWLKVITDRESLDRHLDDWNMDNEHTPIGMIRSLEGADSILSMHHLERAYASGLRAIGPAHYGPGVYAHGTDSEGGIGFKGKELLLEMDKLNIVLDTSHLCDTSFWESLKIFAGPVCASHNNCRALVQHQRQFSDEQLKVLMERQGVIGVALDAWMLIPGWQRGSSTPVGMDVSMSTVANHIDHICQLAGNSTHVGIGSDLDGSFGTEQCPADLDTIADLQKIIPILEQRGYSHQDIQNICSENWIAFYRQALE